MIDWRHCHNEPWLVGGLVLTAGTKRALLTLLGAEANPTLQPTRFVRGRP